MPPKNKSAPPTARDYEHAAKTPSRPEAGTQDRFKKSKPPAEYRYDPSLAPSLEWDESPAREQGEAQIAAMQAELVALREKLSKSDVAKVAAPILARAEEAAAKLAAMGRPFLNWTGKAERASLSVPTLPLFVHERLSTRAILETLKGHSKDKQQSMFELFRDPQRPIADQVLRAYEYQDDWVNRLILGDSLVVMNSLLRYEGLGGQVQMIYMDPPYGVKFGSNFQPFVRRRDVGHNDDEDFTREPEMVQAYRDTWELGLHSYLMYLRDRLILSRELLTPSGSLFVQISDENLHHVRELLDEVFGAEHQLAIIPFRKKTMPLGAKHLESVTDYLLWVCRDLTSVKYQPLMEAMSVEGDSHWNFVELPNGSRRKMTREEINNHRLLEKGSTPIQLVSLYPAGVNEGGLFPFKFRGRLYRPPQGNSWFTNLAGMERLAAANRLEPYEDGETLRYALKLSDSPVTSLTNLWADTSAPSDKTYVVQTSTRVVQRCMLMCTSPGDLVFDPTCGSGTTAYVAEQWGRRWITCDTSRVPLALARQRLLTATYPWYELRDEKRGPVAGFVYKRAQNSRGEEIGGIIPYISKGSIANDEPPAEEVLVDRPEEVRGITRVSGPFCVEATIPRPADMDEAPTAGSDAAFPDRMIEVLRHSPVLRLGKNRTITFKGVRPPAKSLSLSAEATIEGDGFPVAFVFGPENGAISERLVSEAAKEANLKGYAQLFVVGFAIQPNARAFVERCREMGLPPATYVQATPDLMMGDLLKSMRSSQIFSVCGLPEVKVEKVKNGKGPAKYRVKLFGLDVFDPMTMTPKPTLGSDVPAWFLDVDYNELCFHVNQAFFPKTAAWDSLKRALRGTYEESIWDHLAGTESEPFEAGEHKQVAVKVIDERGNELMVIKPLAEAR